MATNTPAYRTGTQDYASEQKQENVNQPSYICGDCGVPNEIRAREPIRCRDCGSRIMYKKRVKRMVQFEAR